MNTDMETGNLIHLGAELVVQMLMLYSTSPHARRLTSEMLTGDPFNIDVKLDMKSKNRNVEILNVYLKTMGLKLEFERKKKKLINPIILDDPIHPAIEFYIPKDIPIDPIIHFHPDEAFDPKFFDMLVNPRVNPITSPYLEPIYFLSPIKDRYIPYTERMEKKALESGEKSE